MKTYTRAKSSLLKSPLSTIPLLVLLLSMNTSCGQASAHIPVPRHAQHSSPDLRPPQHATFRYSTTMCGNRISSAEIYLQQKTFFTVPSGRTAAFKRSMAAQIEQGFLDARHETIPLAEADLEEGAGELEPFIEIKNGQKFLRICQESQRLASPHLQSRMQEKIAMVLDAWVPAYDLSLDLETSVVGQRPLAHFTRCAPMLSAAATGISPVALLSSFAQTWAHQDSKVLGPNCFFSTIAAINPGWDNPRFMGEEEFLHHLGEAFKEIPKLENVGDIIVLAGSDGSPEHAAAFLGKTSDGLEMVFTKNGKTPGKYLFMDTWTLMHSPSLYSGTSARYFRLVKSIAAGDVPTESHDKI